MKEKRRKERGKKEERKRKERREKEERHRKETGRGSSFFRNRKGGKERRKGSISGPRLHFEPF